MALDRESDEVRRFGKYLFWGGIIVGGVAAYVAAAVFSGGATVAATVIAAGAVAAYGTAVGGAAVWSGAVTYQSIKSLGKRLFGRKNKNENSNSASMKYQSLEGERNNVSRPRNTLNRRNQYRQSRRKPSSLDPNIDGNYRGQKRVSKPNDRRQKKPPEPTMNTYYRLEKIAEGAAIFKKPDVSSREYRMSLKKFSNPSELAEKLGKTVYLEHGEYKKYKLTEVPEKELTTDKRHKKVRFK